MISNIHNKGIAVFLFVVSWLLLFATRSIQFVGDSLSIALQVRSGEEMGNAHHLIFAGLNHFIFSASQPIFDWSAITSIQCFNSMMAAVGLVLFYKISSNVLKSVWLGLMSAVILLVSLKYWQFSTQAEVYIAASTCTLVIVFMIIQNRYHTKKDLLLMAVFWSLAVLFNQMSVLYVLPLLLVFIVDNWRSALFKTLGIILIAGALSIIAYGITYINTTDEESLQGFVRYCLGYAFIHPDWGSSGHFFDLSEIKRLFFNQLQAFIPAELARKVKLSVFALCTIFLFGWHLIYRISHKAMYKLRIFLVGILITHYVFILWWTPGYEFFVALIFPYLLLVLLFMYDLTELIKSSIQQPTFRIMSIALLLLIGLFVSVNVTSFVDFHKHHNDGYLMAERIRSITKEECTSIVDYNVEQNLQFYFNHPTVVETDGVYLNYYHLEEKRERFLFDKNDCKVMALWHLNPWFNSLGSNGWNKSTAWENLVFDLFDIEQTDSSISIRDFELFPGTEALPAVIYIKENKVQYSSLLEFFIILDKQIIAQDITNEAVYESWYRKKLE